VDAFEALRKISDQAPVKPQLAGLSGDIVTSLAASISTHAPVDPSRGQLAPPSASTVARAQTTHGPSGVSTANRPCSSHPVSGGAARISRRSSRAAAAMRQQRRGLHRLGKNRPLEPTKVGWPNPRSMPAKRPAEMLQWLR